MPVRQRESMQRSSRKRGWCRALTCLPTPGSKDKNQPPAEGKDIFDRAGECDPAGKAQPGCLFLESGAALVIAQDGELRLCLGGKCRELGELERSRLRWPRQRGRRRPSAFGSRRGLWADRPHSESASNLETGSLLPRAQRSDLFLIHLGTSAFARNRTRSKKSRQRSKDRALCPSGMGAMGGKPAACGSFACPKATSCRCPPAAD